MQPYFVPYLGYFQLIANSDLFVVYDRIKYTKKGWINRNRILRNGKDVYISLPIKGAPDDLHIVERYITDDFNPQKLSAQIEGAYRKAPFYSDTKPLIDEILYFQNHNLFEFTTNSIKRICAHLRINTPICTSSNISDNENLKSQEKVIALCQSIRADIYINPIGGIELYDKDLFRDKGIDLRFMRSIPFLYEQFENQFIPSLSIIDVMMFNSIDVISDQINTGWNYE
jgi:hypothetical protein